MTFPERQPPILMIISGPAGCGKTTLCQRLVDSFEEAERAITCTTRAPRSGEVDRKDYYFFTDEQFDRSIAEGEFLEWAEVHGARYGTLRHEVATRLDSGRSVVLNIDVQGAAAIRAAAGKDDMLTNKLVTIIVLLPSLDVLRERMTQRGTDPEQAIDQRLKNAELEMSHWTDYDFCVLSGSKEEDYRQVESIWIAEKHRVERLRAANT